MAEKQTVIIPKGLISPGQDAVIEIPANLQGPGTVVAKLKSSPGNVTNRSLSSAGGSPGSPGSSVSPGSPRTPRTPDVAGMWSSSGSARSPWSPGSPSPQQSFVRKATARNQPRSFDQQYNEEFDPSFTSSPQGAEDTESSVYKDFRPRYAGTFRHTMSPAADYLSPETSRMRSFELGNLSPQQQQAQASRESSYGGDYYTDSSYTSGSEVLSSLSGIERREMSLIVGDLSGYQSARRKLIFDTSSLQSASDISGDLVRHTI